MQVRADVSMNVVDGQSETQEPSHRSFFLQDRAAEGEHVAASLSMIEHSRQTKTGQVRGIRSDQFRAFLVDFLCDSRSTSGQEPLEQAVASTQSPSSRYDGCPARLVPL